MVLREVPGFGLAAALLMSGAAARAGDVVTLSANFEPNPMSVDVADPGDKIQAFKLGIRNCGSVTSQTPAMTIDVREAITIQIRGGDADSAMRMILSNESNQFLCSQWSKLSRQPEIQTQLKPGRYSLRLVDPPTSHVKLGLRDVGRSSASTVLTLDASFRPNPMYVDASIPEADATIEELGIRCEASNSTGTSRSPAMILDLKYATDNLTIESERPLVLLREGGQGYYCGERGQISVKADAGRYAVRFLGEGGKTTHLVIHDTMRPIAFPDGIRTVEAPARLDKPFAIDGEVQATRAREPIVCWSDTRKPLVTFPRTPDFFLKTTRPLTKVAIQMAWARGEQRVWLLGPMEAVTARTDAGPKCVEKSRFDLLSEGTYAVWVGDERSAGTSHFRVVMTSETTSYDSLTTFGPPSAGLSMNERQLGLHYPFLGHLLEKTRAAEDLQRRLFLEAPIELFVFARIDYEGMRAGEPLLVLNGGTLLAADGVTFTPPPAAIATSPAEIVVPKTPRLAEVNPSDALALARPEDGRKVAAWEARSKALHDCYDRVWRQHDRSGHASNIDIVTFKNGKAVSSENLGDRISRLAVQTCHPEPVEAALVALGKQLSASRLRARTEWLSEIAARMQKEAGRSPAK
jgi:hypothetical protein